MEWQLIDKDQWVFGKKIRGIIRIRYAEVYYSESTSENDYSGGWIWFLTNIPRNYNPPRGTKGCLTDAIESAEQALEKEGILDL